MSDVMFKEGVVREQMMLLPECVEDYVSEGHLARIVSATIAMLKLDKIISKFSSLGQNAFSPRILISILFYGYAIGVRSSRKLSKACEERLDFIYLARKLTPSYKVISEFRRTNLEELKEIFKDIVQIGKGIGLVRIGNIKTSIDGTKIRACASAKKTKDEEGLAEALKEVEEEITKMFNEAEQTDKAEDEEYGDKRGDEIPEELSKLENQRKKIAQAMRILQERKEAKKEEKLAEKGDLSKKEETKIDQMKINLTDKDANYMKERNGCIKPNYNCQASVEEEKQFIVANDVTTEANDLNQLQPMVKKSEENLEAKVDVVKADAGYQSIENLKNMSDSAHEHLIDDSNKKRVENPNYKFEKVNFNYEKDNDEYKCPAGRTLKFKRTAHKDGNPVRLYEGTDCEECPYRMECCGNDKDKRVIERREFEELVEANINQLLSEDGRKEYQKRMYTVEPVFGHLKFNLGYRHFLLKGRDKVAGEFNLMCIGYDLRKIAKKIKETGIDLFKNQQIALEMV